MSTAATSSSSMAEDVILKMAPLPVAGPFPTLDPFLFCVYHKDDYPEAVNDQMEIYPPGNGADFNPDAPYRMYHGDSIPGFPQHPHRGFETVTATMEGLVDHADSVGNAGRYGQGDVQWMTAGKGVVHSELFPLLKMDEPNPLKLFQIWLNLPAKDKMCQPGFTMIWNDTVPIHSTAKNSKVYIWAGRNYWESGDNNPPPPNSWAADPQNDVAIWHIVLDPSDKEALTLPAAHIGKDANRSLFYVKGPSQAVTFNGEPLRERVYLNVRADQELVLQCTDLDTQDETVEFLLLQGRPIKEPVVSHGPFVMNTQAEIHRAFMDYQMTQFGGWPHPRDDMVFERTKGRFALINGVETTPNQLDSEKGETNEAANQDEL